MHHTNLYVSNHPLLAPKEKFILEDVADPQDIISQSVMVMVQCRHLLPEDTIPLVDAMVKALKKLRNTKRKASKMKNKEKRTKAAKLTDQEK